PKRGPAHDTTDDLANCSILGRPYSPSDVDLSWRRAAVRLYPPGVHSLDVWQAAMLLVKQQGEEAVRQAAMPSVLSQSAISGITILPTELSGRSGRDDAVQYCAP